METMVRPPWDSPAFTEAKPGEAGPEAFFPTPERPREMPRSSEVSDLPLPEEEDEPVIPGDQRIEREMPPADPFASALPEDWAEVVKSHSGGTQPERRETREAEPEPALATAKLGEAGKRSEDGKELRAEPPAPADPSGLWGDAMTIEDVDDRLAILQHRLGVVEEYLEKAAEDRVHGIISEEMWREESDRWAREKETLARDIRALREKKAA
jgi:hypothetical protein